MTDTQVAPAAAPPADPAGEARGGLDWMDAAGLIAGVLLLVILADIFTDGRVVSRRLHRGKGGDGDANEQPGEQ